jgi:hypothetical protein
LSFKLKLRILFFPNPSPETDKDLPKVTQKARDKAASIPAFIPHSSEAMNCPSSGELPFSYLPLAALTWGIPLVATKEAPWGSESENFSKGNQIE